MTRSEIKECLYEKYILPTERKKGQYVGVEIEMPVVNLAGGKTVQKYAQETMSDFCGRFGFAEDKWDENGICFSATRNENGDNISFDCSYNNLELSLGKAVSISELEQRFQEYVTYINHELQRNNHILTGMGVNPNREANDKAYIPSERYRMLEHYLKQSKVWDIPMYFHDYPDFGAFSSASQVQLDVEREHLIPVLKAFSLLEPVKAVLFNKSVTDKKDQTYALYAFTQFQLSHTLLPIGDYCKEDVRRIAKTLNLAVAEKPDSQEICFIPGCH